MRRGLFRGRGRGFTIVEVLIVVSIVGIIAAIVGPRIGQTATHTLPSAARLLAADLQYAQLQSIQRAGDDLAGVLFFDDGSGYRLGFIDDDITAPMPEPSSHQDFEVRFGQGRAASLDGITISATSLNDETYLTFNVFGGLEQASSDNATITLSAQGMSVTITIDPTNGHIQISDL